MTIRNVAAHICWLSAMQQPDGSFRDPFSRRRALVDTYFAVACLHALGHRMEDSAKCRCQKWARHELFRTQRSQGAIDAARYCWGTLRMLGAVDQTITQHLVRQSHETIRHLAAAKTNTVVEQRSCAIEVAIECEGLPALRRDCGNALDTITQHALHALGPSVQ